MKKLLCFILCAIMLFALVACGGEKTPEVTDGAQSGDGSAKLNGVAITEYKIEAANDDAKNAAALLSELLADCGITLTETAENTIIVGDSKTTLSDNEYVYEADGKTVYVNGNGADAYEAAVLLFVYDILGYDGYNADEVKLENVELTSVKHTYADSIEGKFAPIEIYVATNGNDSAAGTKEAPLATLSGAVNVLESIAGKTLHPIAIKLGAGEYMVDKTVKLTKINSGKLYSPVEFSAEDGADVKLVGGVKLSASEAVKVTDAAILDRIANAEAKDNIYVIDLSPYFSSIDEVSNQSIDDYYPVQLYVDGKAQTIARYPNDGSIEITAWATDMEGDGFPFYFIYMTDEAGKHAETYWSQLTYEHAFATGFFSSDSYDEGLSIYEVALETSETRKENIGKYYFRTYTQIYDKITVGQNFYFHNLLEEIDVSGEYYIDTVAKKLYFYSDGNISDDMYVSKLGETMINIASGASDITFKGIDIGYTRGKAINAQGAKRIVIEDCSISGISSNAISLTSTTDSVVKNVSILDCGRGGIVLTRCGSVTSGTNANITISGCTVKNVNLVKHTGSACLSLTNTCGITLSDNTFDCTLTILEDNVKNITK